MQKVFWHSTHLQGPPCSSQACVGGVWYIIPNFAISPGVGIVYWEAHHRTNRGRPSAPPTPTSPSTYRQPELHFLSACGFVIAQTNTVRGIHQRGYRFIWAAPKAYLGNHGKHLPQQVVGEMLPVVVHDPGAQRALHLHGEWVLIPFLHIGGSVSLPPLRPGWCAFPVVCQPTQSGERGLEQELQLLLPFVNSKRPWNVICK